MRNTVAISGLTLAMQAGLREDIEKGLVPQKGLHCTTSLHEMHCRLTWIYVRTREGQQARSIPVQGLCTEALHDELGSVDFPRRSSSS